MQKTKKIKLSSVAVLCIAIVLLSLTAVLSYISVDSIKAFGKKSIHINEQSTRNNAMIFFLEITRRTAGEYATYLSAVDNFVDIVGSQVKRALTEDKSKIPNTEHLNFSKLNNFDLYAVPDQNDFNCFYCSEENGLTEAENHADRLTSLLPLFETIHTENAPYFSCIWIMTSADVIFEYPYYYDYKNMNGNLMRKYFKTIFSEFPPKLESSKTNIIWTKPYKDISNTLNLDAYKYIFADTGQFLATVGIDLDFNKILNTIINNNLFSDKKTKLSRNLKNTYNKMKGFIFIVDKDGSIILFPNEYSNLLSLPEIEYSKLKEYPDKLTVKLNDSVNPEIRKMSKDIENSDIGVKRFNLKGNNYIIAHKSINATNWILCFATLESSLMSSIEETKKAMELTKQELTKRFYIISLIFFIIFIIISIMFFKFFLMKPLLRLREKVRKIGKGNFNIYLDESGFAEISDLSVSFNILTKELKDYTKNLEVEVKQRQTIETELEIAAKLQVSVLPKITDEFINEKFELNAKLIPANEMSGDFYDFFFVNKETLCLVLADVCGKGITAAFYMSMAKAIIKESCLGADSLETGKIMEKINNTLHSSVTKKPMFLTMYLVYYNINTGKLTFTNAGHNEYVIVNEKGQASFSGEAHNSFVGFFKNLEYGKTEIFLKPGEIFALFTDGINDAHNVSKEYYEETRLPDIFDLCYQKDLSAYCSSIIDDVMKFQSGNKMDDITLIMLKRKS